MTVNVGFSAGIMLLDEEDADLGLLRWWDGVKGYAIRYIGGGRANPTIEHCHRVVLERKLGRPISAYVDHINGNGLDNQRANLREATSSQNQANRSKYARNTATSQFKGVRRERSAWEASIRVQGRFLYLGRFASERQAAKAYNQAAEFHFGEFASLNDL